MDIHNLALRPNCLLTKYPIVFVTGPRSLFFQKKLGGELQDFIAAHGYRVMSPPLPFRSKNLRRLYFEKWLQNQSQQRFHFILSRKTYNEFSEFFEKLNDSTYTITGEKFPMTITRKPLGYRLHTLFCKLDGHTADPYNETLPVRTNEFYDRFLDHCVELAENDVI